MESPGTEERRACWIWKAEEVASGRKSDAVVRCDNRIAGVPMHMLSLVKGVARIIALAAGDTPPPALDRGDEYGLMREEVATLSWP